MGKKILLLFVVSLVLLLFLPCIGITRLSWSAVLAGGQDSFIFWQLRVPRTLLGFLTGALLGLAGLIFQNIFKNALATPDTLGVSSGAAFAAVVAIKLGLPLSWLGFSAVSLCGFLGALLAVVVIFAIVRLVRSTSVYTLLMAGVAMNLFFSALIVLLQYLLDFTNTYAILRWLMGGIAVSGYHEVWVLTPLLLLFLAAVLLFRREMLLISAGDEFAAARGMNVTRFRMLVFVGASLMVGVSVSLTGPIGFVALVVPHVARLLARHNFTAAVFITFLIGGDLLAVADLAARIIIPPAEVPVGVITAFIGAPFFLIILISGLRRR